MFRHKIIGIVVFLVCSLSYSTAAFSRNVEVGVAAFSVDGVIPARKTIEAFENKLGRQIDALNWFLGFNADTGDLPEFPLSSLKQNVPSRIIPMLTWEPWGDAGLKDGHQVTPFDKINEGKLDNYIISYAKAMKAYGKIIRLRFGHEMIQNDNPVRTIPNFKWYPWQDFPEDYKKAYIRIYSIFKAQGADNVQFVWALNFEPYFIDVIPKYYPGPNFVDWIGIDGYNWKGQDFDGVFNKMYRVITGHPEIFGDKPIMLSEIGAAKADVSSFDKAQWIKDAFSKIELSYPKISAFYWFNVNKERDWRLDESSKSWQAFKNAMGSAIYKPQQ